MDILKTVKQGLALTLAAWLTLCPGAPALATELGTETVRVDPHQMVYDYADIFTENEEANLREIAQEYSERLSVHFVILAINDSSVDNLEAYCDEFYLRNIAGADEINDCAFMQINMGTRRVANRYYGELRALISDREADEIGDGFGGYMSASQYENAAQVFLDESARLISDKFNEYHVEIPEVNPDELIYDFDGVLTDEEYSQLYDDALNICSKTGVNHVVVILRGEADEQYLQKYARSFYKKNFQGSDSFLNLSVLVVSVGGGTASITPYGNYMPQNDELWETNWTVQSMLRHESVFAGCEYFLGQQSIDPLALVYDMNSLLSEEEYNQMADAARDISNEMGTAHIIVILQDAVENDRLSWFADVFYKKYIQQGGSNEGVLMLVVSAEGQAASVKSFGKYQMGENEANRIADNVCYRLRNNSVFTACQYFLYIQADMRQAELLEMPNIDPAKNIHDFAGVLTDEEIGNLQALISENYKKYGVDLQIICSDIKGPYTLDAFQNRLSTVLDDYELGHANGNYSVLLIGSPTGIEGEDLYVGMSFSGDKIRRKIRYSLEWDIRIKIRNAVGNDDSYYGACMAYVNDISKAVSSLIPNVNMVDEIDWALSISLLAAFAIPLAVVLILRLIHNFGLKRKISAHNYLVGDSIKLYFTSDIFLHTHTTQTKIVHDTDSGGSSSGGGGSSGSSGGGISSGSERSF